jgi:hypothetical protein
MGQKPGPATIMHLGVHFHLAGDKVGKCVDIGAQKILMVIMHCQSL